MKEGGKMFSNRDVFFYCYSPKLFHYFIKRGFKYICSGLNESTGIKFWQFSGTTELNKALAEYRLLGSKDTVRKKDR